MTIEKTQDGGRLTVKVSGRIDTITSAQFEEALALDGVKELLLDFAGVEYISSAGLRVLVKANKQMMANGGALKIAGVQPIVREVFDITGFADIFTLI